MPPTGTLQLPVTEARQRWNIQLLAGFDYETTLGLPIVGTIQSLIPGNFGISNLDVVGSALDLDLDNTRRATQRRGFNATPLNDFQVAPHGVSYGLNLTQVSLRVLPAVQATFAFMPSNLLFQQLLLVLHLTDFGDGTQPTFIEHWIYGCWFTNTKTRYSVSDKQNTMLIPTATILPGRMLTYDASGQGSVSTGSALLGILSGVAASAGGVIQTLTNLNF
jgi:hypothetical protein